MVGSGPGQAVAVGELGAIVEIEDGATTLQSSHTSAGLTAVALDDHGLWATGQDGTLLRYRR